MHLHSIYNDMVSDGISFCFTGFMSEEMLLGVGATLKKKMQLESIEHMTSKSMFSLFVEMVQNVIRYSAEYQFAPAEPVDIDLRYGILSIGVRDGQHFVACGNLIKDEDVPRLSKNLQHIQTLEKDDLKKLYKATLKGDVPEGSKGAGVGFMEIARRASGGFTFDFVPDKDGKHFFTISAFL
ncbi:MAG: SiaB family protein kinase [Rhodospirillaceae bacterium]